MSRYLEKKAAELKYEAENMADLISEANREAKRAKLKLKIAMKRGNSELIQIYAETAVRKEKLVVTYSRMAARYETISERISLAAKNAQLSQKMGGVMRGFNAALKQRDLDKIEKIMDTVERQMEDTDVKFSYMEHSMDAATVFMSPEDEVRAMIEKVSDVSGLDVREAMSEAPRKSPVSIAEAAVIKDCEELYSRIERLNGTASAAKPPRPSSSAK